VRLGFRKKKKKRALTGLRVLCSLKLSSRIAAWSLDSLSFFLEVSPSSSSLIPWEEALSISCSSPLIPSLSLLFPLILDIVLFGDETPASSSQSAVDGNLFTSIPRRNDLVSARCELEFGSAWERWIWVWNGAWICQRSKVTYFVGYDLEKKID